MTIKLVQTSNACPEQYDAFLNGEQVGYLHLRHGYFYALCPTGSGEIVFRSEPNGDGSFLPDERALHLTAACLAIQNWAASRKDQTVTVYEFVSRDEV